MRIRLSALDFAACPLRAAALKPPPVPAPDDKFKGRTDEL